MNDSETPRQRFLRNHGELDAMFRLRATEAEREGDAETAAALDAMRATWQGFADRARREESEGRDE